MSLSTSHRTRKHDRPRSPPPYSSGMAIPRQRDHVPPPLPPPQYLPELSRESDPGWQWANDPAASDYGRPAVVKPGSSLLGGSERHRRNGSSHSSYMVRDVHMEDDRHDRLQSERRLEHTTFQGSSQAYDKQLLSRIGGPSTPRKQSLSGSPAIDPPLPHLDTERRNSQLRVDGNRLLPSMSSTSPRLGHARNGSSQAEDAIFAHDEFPMDSNRSPSSSEDMLRGAKRRASSPPYDTHDDHLSPRKQLPNASISSVSTSGRGSASLISSVGMASTASSATSYASGVRSPENVNELAVRSIAQPRQMDTARSQESGSFLCECCPKKPKKFETAEELKTHESEKQYACAYCPNRFKNKNEAERHQNSLHLRRHSWSCAALTTPQAAFHLSTNGNGHDICGFCGQEYSNPPDWSERTQHLTLTHKYGQCNLVKKFFRADHFRQHLKHSHDGTSGKWTNMLESACMKDEPLPPKMGSMQEGSGVQFVVGSGEMSDLTDR